MELSNLQLLLLLQLQSLPLATAETVLGAYIFHRHGDRTTKSYTPVSLTTLGAEQVFYSGSWFRSNYIAEDASSQIHNIASTLPVLSQLSVTSPVDNTLQNSAAYFVQGLYPPAGTASAQTLANGTSVESPLNGSQNIPINAVSTAASSSGSEDSSWLQGISSCPLAVVSSNNYLQSTEYLATLASTRDFYQQDLMPVYNSTFSSDTATFKNAYTIYDYVHVSTIHNASDSIPSHDLLTNETLLQLQTRADQHEWGLAFNASEPIRAINGAVLAAQIVDALNTTLQAAGSSAKAQRLTVQFGAYATFMAFFGLAQAPAASPDFYGIVDYASSIVFELVTNATVGSAAVDPADVSVRFLFANGSASDSNAPRAFPLFGQSETLLPWSTFASNMSVFSIGTTEAWCTACGNSTGVCARTTTSSSSGTGSTTSARATDAGEGGVSRPVAGVIGALVTLVVILGLEALIMGVAGLRLVKKSSAGKPADRGSVPTVAHA